MGRNENVCLLFASPSEADEDWDNDDGDGDEDEDKESSTDVLSEELDLLSTKRMGEMFRAAPPPPCEMMSQTSFSVSLLICEEGRILMTLLPSPLILSVGSCQEGKRKVKDDENSNKTESDQPNPPNLLFAFIPDPKSFNPFNP